MGRPKGAKNGHRQQGVCNQCGIVFDKPNHASKFCGRKCYEISKRKYSTCRYCLKVFRNSKGTVCCSRSCASKSTVRKSGYRLTDEHRKKIGDAQRGDKANNWKGGTWSSQPQSERKSARYKTLRKEVMERDRYSCVLCGSKGYLEVDHIKSYSKYPDLRFEKNNLRTLCKPCHRLTPTFARG